ncbi:MAG: DUF3443 family protein [Nitrospiraceae bacterium]|nr:DUF3443 family protein [Nitrospiraceae bacterium]
MPSGEAAMKTRGTKSIGLLSVALLLFFLAGCGGGGGGSSSSPASNGTPSSSSSTGTCTAVAVSLSGQVQNPVPLLPTDNNGTLVELPGVSNDGASSASGSLVLGIGTESNNQPSSVTAAIPLNSRGDFTTVLNGLPPLDSFIDTGSNGLFFPQVSKNNPPICSAPLSSWYCPQTPFTNTATQEGGSASVNVTFTIENFETLTSSGNKMVFPDIGGQMNSAFDWGLPFYLGRNVFMGIEGKSSNLGDNGLYFASGVYNGSQPSGANVMPISVSGSVPGLATYNNEPMVSITVCAPGTSACQTINGILLDTGSYGLRIFKQALNGLSLPPEKTSGGQLAECQPYVDLTADWGPVELADVKLGGEPAVTSLPIQVIDATFPGYTNCNGGSSLDTSPSIDGYNGILGVGPFQQDCGSLCTNVKNSNQVSQWPYWSCSQ